MSIELVLLPFDGDFHNMSYSHTVLQVNQDYELFNLISNLNQLQVPKTFNSYLSKDDSYEESHYGLTIETPYGEILTYTLAKELKKCNIPAATGAYINALPDDTKVALYWC